MSQPHERTFLMIKPDGVQRGLVGTIIERFEKKGLKLVAIKCVKPSEQLLREQYSDRSNKSYFLSHLKYMSSGPVVPMVWEGLNVVKTGRQMLGGTKPENSLPGTIRGDLSISFHNVIHGSDSIESANKEIGMWFKAEELHNWTPVTENCIYQ